MNKKSEQGWVKVIKNLSKEPPYNWFNVKWISRKFQRSLKI